jgi:hypothetical protein
VNRATKIVNLRQWMMRVTERHPGILRHTFATGMPPLQQLG